eukprot:c9528_g1_i1.p1 GENE.c9528_g1_i1~~c9528_g1_i1.p1  ORF type:complete len:561 (+),score=103.89 c9528_g1_i1:26-1684(+)
MGKDRRRSNIVAPDTLDVSIVTWNVGNEQPFARGHEDPGLAALIPYSVDLLVIGFQECSYNAGSAKSVHRDFDEDEDKLVAEGAEFDLKVLRRSHQNLKNKKPVGKVLSSKFIDRVLAEYLSKFNMVPLASKELNQMKLLIFVQRTMRRAFSELRMTTEATGLMGVYGNKGGILITLTYRGARLSFVNSHLAAHLPHIFSRNDNVIEILEGTHIFERQLDITLQSDHVFWFGDMNYRIDPNYQPGMKPIKVKSDSEEYRSDYAKIMEIINRKNFAELKQFDQLSQEIARGAIFHNFQEMKLDFAPTFKVLRGRQLAEVDKVKPDTSDHLYSMQRIPSYCDRVLWHSLPAVKSAVTPISVTSVPAIDTSDHKPVRALFRLRTFEEPVKFSEPNENSQLMFTNITCTGGDMAERVGFYLVFSCYPTSLISKLVTRPTTKPIWPGPINLRIKVRPLVDATLDVRPAIETNLHVIITVVDDKIGLDETCGDAILPIGDVIQRNDTVQFSVPLIQHTRDTGAVLSGTLAIVNQKEPGWQNWSQRKKIFRVLSKPLHH